MGNPVVYFEVLGRDATAMKAFYSAAFDWAVGPSNPTLNAYAEVTTNGGAGIDGGIGSGMHDYAGHVTFYVAVPSLEDALAKIEALGGRTMIPPGAIPAESRIAMFADPEGHIVGLIEMEAKN